MGVLGEQQTYDPWQFGRFLADIRQPLQLVQRADGARGLALRAAPDAKVLGILPALYPEWLGSRAFAETHDVRLPYVAGAMANGIASVDLVAAMARSRMLAFFGAAGLSPQNVDQSLRTLRERLPRATTLGVNLIHSPQEPELENTLVDLYLRQGIQRISASAYMTLAKPVVRLAFQGIRVLPDGRVQRPRYVFAKISRPEVARHFMAPPPAALVNALLQEGALSAQEAQLARVLPVAEDVIVEADSGGHTDNQSLLALLPTILALRDELQRSFEYVESIRIGAAGGLGTPHAVSAAFAAGADFVLTGSVNQACVEAGLHPDAKAQLAQAQLGDVMMAPAADMFEMGVKVQVLKRGTLFGPRAHMLYDAYRRYRSFEAMPQSDKERLEQEVFRCTIGEMWRATADYWQARDVEQLRQAETDPSHRMALVCRSYLGQASRWAIRGTTERQADFQIWCGPAMGAFNSWAKGSFLEHPPQRQVVQVALNLMEGAAYLTRVHQARTAGLPIRAQHLQFTPRPLELG